MNLFSCDVTWIFSVRLIINNLTLNHPYFVKIKQQKYEFILLGPDIF